MFDGKTWAPTSDPNGIFHGTLKIVGESHRMPLVARTVAAYSTWTGRTCVYTRFRRSESLRIRLEHGKQPKLTYYIGFWFIGRRKNQSCFRLILTYRANNGYWCVRTIIYERSPKIPVGDGNNTSRIGQFWIWDENNLHNLSILVQIRNRCLVVGSISSMPMHGAC